jgi:PAS domain S-box-containing protein
MAIETRQPVLRPVVAEADVAATASDARHLEILRAMGISSAMSVPLIAHDRLLGSLSFARSRPDHPYDPADLALAEELARRAALALDNARLYQETRQAAQRVDETLALLDTLLASAPVGFAFYDYELRFLRINETMAAINGLPVEAHLGRTLAEVLPDMAPALDPLFRHILETGISILNREFVGEWPPSSGERHTWLASYYPVYTKDRQLLGVGAMVSDITEHKRAQAALSASQELYRLITEHTSDLISLLDDTGRYIYASPSYQALLGYEPEALVGITAMDLLHPDDRPILIAKWRQLLDQPDGSIQASCRIRNVHGEWFWIESSGSASERQGRRVLVIVSRDITERRRLEAQFLQSQKMESIGRLAGGIAHDFNNLLTAITGYTDLAMDSLPNDHPAHSDLQEIQRAADRAAGLTNQLLSFARKRVIASSIFNLNDLVRDMEGLLRRLIGEEHVLIIQPDTLLGPVRADPSQIEQVLINLVVNACDAMPAGGTLTITTSDAQLDADYALQHAGADVGAYALISISDTGTGIPPEVQPHIFEPFYTTKERSKGTGLGLATCYGIVKQHGGSIWFSSKAGQGTTFSVYLPRADGPAQLLPHRSEPAQLPRGDETVLLVEDEAMLRTLTARVLRDLGYQVLEASQGAQAIELVLKQTQPLDLLLTDIVMPGMRGNLLAEHLIDLLPNLKVLFMSGYVGSALEVHDLPGARAAFLQKPFSPDLLARKLREVLDV